MEKKYLKKIIIAFLISSFCIENVFAFNQGEETQDTGTIQSYEDAKWNRTNPYHLLQYEESYTPKENSINNGINNDIDKFNSTQDINSNSNRNNNLNSNENLNNQNIQNTNFEDTNLDNSNFDNQNLKDSKEKPVETKKSDDEEAWDPWEPMNRGIFWFNDVSDTYLIGPISKGYDFIMPDVAQEGVSNFFDNLLYPINLISDLIRLDFSDMGTHTSRFLINSTIGIAGLMDVATDFGIEDRETSIGLALRDVGVPAGPYLVMPFLGPSTCRDGLSTGAEAFAHPFAIMNYTDVRSGITDKVTYIGGAVDSIQTRVNLDETLESAKESSVDYYLFMRSAYYQYQNGQLKKLRREKVDDKKDAKSSDGELGSSEEDWDF